jgi:hypothetical protein
MWHTYDGFSICIFKAMGPLMTVDTTAHHAVTSLSYRDLHGIPMNFKLPTIDSSSCYCLCASDIVPDHWTAKLQLEILLTCFVICYWRYASFQIYSASLFVWHFVYSRDVNLVTNPISYFALISSFPHEWRILGIWEQICFIKFQFPAHVWNKGSQNADTIVVSLMIVVEVG